MVALGAACLAPAALAHTTKKSPPKPAPKGNPVAGKAIFTQYFCADCHTLKAAAAVGELGPNLDSLKPPYALVLATVQAGLPANKTYPTSMISYKKVLTQKQMRDVSTFVANATH